ncbi:MAG: APC family permease [Chloroflexi bacterium]|nr:APC family permease [Chloroflexota bacterium]
MSATGTEMKRTLGLTGITMNAMALIAPGAFLWITFQVQAANVNAAGASTAADMWTGIVVALLVAMLTALSFAQLARKYPNAGSGSAYYFAEKAFLDKSSGKHRRWARLAKFVTGWAAHLFYWVYPGVMVAFMATLVIYIIKAFAPGIAISLPIQILIACAFSAMVGLIAVRGINGSTTVSIIINVIQLTALVVFSILAISFRVRNPLHVPADAWLHPNASSIVMPHNLMGMLFQSSIAILILVGFESSTAFAAEAKNPRRDIPIAVIISLLVQGLFAYLFEYFAANYALGDWFMSADGTLKGLAAAAASGAPIGDMAIMLGNTMLSGNGFALMVVLALTVAIAILGTTLSAMNTGVRITFAMAQDKEMPGILGLLHAKYATPYVGVLLMVIISAVIGSIGVAGGVVALTGITLASNLGTFILYGLICLITIVAFIGTPEFRVIKHALIPFLGFISNLGMVLVIFVVGINSGGTTASATYLALGIAGLWLVVSFAYLFISSRAKGVAIVPKAAAAEQVPADSGAKVG